MLALVGVTHTSGDRNPDTSLGSQLNPEVRDQLLALKEQLIADELSGTTHDAVVTPVKSPDEAIVAFGGEDTVTGRWGGELFETLSEQGFTSTIFSFAPDKVIRSGDGTSDRKRSVIEINNQLTYMVSVLRNDDGKITSAVAEPTEYKRGNATLVWRAESGVPLFDALDSTRGREHARTAGKCRAVNHTRNPDGSYDYEGHLRRITQRLEEPVERFLRQPAI